MLPSFKTIDEQKKERCFQKIKSEYNFCISFLFLKKKRKVLKKMALIKNMFYAGLFGILFALVGIFKQTKLMFKTIQVPCNFLIKDPVSYAALLQLQQEIGPTPAFTQLVHAFDSLIQMILSQKLQDAPQLQKDIALQMQRIHMKPETNTELTKTLQSLISFCQKQKNVSD